MTALGSNGAFSTKGQNFNGSPQAKNGSPACLSIALELDAIFFLVYLRMCKTSRGTADMKFMAP